MKILSAAQTRALDAYTIAQEPITSLDLMERASKAFVQAFLPVLGQFKAAPTIYIFCGNGNNGGDGFAVARLLKQKGLKPKVFRLAGKAQSPDCAQNQNRWGEDFEIIQQATDFPAIPPQAIIIDALFGSGLSRPLEGLAAELVDYLNQQEAYRLALDIASGLYADRPREGVAFKAVRTISFELPKLAFFIPENAEFVGEWQIIPIGLSVEFIEQTESDYALISPHLFKSLLKPRPKYAHKGTYGHALLMLGSYGKIGAALLAAKACLRAGAGLLTLHLPTCGYQIAQTALPEVMVSPDKGEHYLETLPDLFSKPYQAIAMGCGIDQMPKTEMLLEQLLSRSRQPLLLDADALNILGNKPDWLEKLPKDSILTPHLKEFSRLMGKSSENHFERLAQLRTFAQQYRVFLLLKGAHTAIATPEGQIFFNTTGNPGMATAGSGDVLTGIIAGLLSQGLSPQETVLAGAYCHGLAGDIAAERLGENALMASDITEALGQAFQYLKKSLGNGQ